MNEEIAGGFVVRNKKLLMIKEESGCWNVPSEKSDAGELSSDTALRAVKNVIQAECEVHKYKSRMKTEFEEDGKKYSWKPYEVNIDEKTQAETEKRKWVPVKEIKQKELAKPLQQTADEVIKRVK